MKNIKITENEAINIRAILLTIERLAEQPATVQHNPSIQNLLSALIGLKELGTKLDDGMIDLEYLRELESMALNKRGKE